MDPDSHADSRSTPKATKSEIDMDDPPNAHLAKDPDAYRQGFRAGFTKADRNRRVYTTNTFSYQLGYVEGSAHRRDDSLS